MFTDWVNGKVTFWGWMWNWYCSVWSLPHSGFETIVWIAWLLLHLTILSLISIMFLAAKEYGIIAAIALIVLGIVALTLGPIWAFTLLGLCTLGTTFLR